MNKETEKIINSLEDVAKRNYIIVEDSRVSSAIYQPSREATLYVNFHTANLLLDYIESKDKEIERLNNIIKNLDKMFEYYFLGNLKYDQDTVNTIYIKYVKLKALKEGK